MPSRNIRDAVQELQDKWPKILLDYEKQKPGFTLIITCSHRTPEEQWILFNKGRKIDIQGIVYEVDRTQVVTNCDGKHTMSSHNFYPARAIDVAVKNITNEAITWDEGHYHPLVAITEKYNLTSGGSWQHLRDWPHIEVKNPKEYKSA